MMTISPNFYKLVGGAVLLFLIVFGSVAWLQEHDARIKAQATQAAQQQVMDAAQKQIDQAKQDSANAAEKLAAQIADLEKQKQQPVTPDQFIAGLQKLAALPQAPVVVQIPTTPAPPPGAKASAAAPAPQAAVEIPAADLPALRNYKLGCDEAAAKLNACQLTEASDQVQIKAQGDQLKATAAERDAYKAASKGGSFLHRLKGDMKCLAITGGAAAAGAWAYKKSPAIGAVAGVAGGQVACRLF